MPNIISNSELQKNPGKLMRESLAKGIIVTSHGKPKMLMVPYFEESDELLEEYLEQYEMWRNRKQLKSEAAESLASGKSDFVL